MTQHTETQPAGYIAIDASHTAIYGTGKTPDQAVADAVQNGDHDTTPDQFTAAPATQALLTQVEREGGNIAWGYLCDGPGGACGTACTLEEEV